MNEFKNTDYSFKNTDNFTSKGSYGQDINDPSDFFNHNDPLSPYYNSNQFGYNVDPYNTPQQQIDDLLMFNQYGDVISDLLGL